MKKVAVIDNLSNLIDDKIERESIQNLLGQPLPAKVIKYDHIKRTADVQCLIQVTDENGDVLDNPPIYNVPVVSYSTKTAMISLPIQQDDEGILIFTQVGIENWFINGGIQEEHMLTKNGINNCFFIPSVFNQTIQSEADNAEDIIIKLSTGELRIKKNGKGKITFNQENILKNLSDQIVKISSSINTIASALNTLSSLTVIDPVSGSNPINPAVSSALVVAKTQIEANMTQLDTIKQLFDKSYDI